MYKATWYEFSRDDAVNEESLKLPELRLAFEYRWIHRPGVCVQNWKKIYWQKKKTFAKWLTTSCGKDKTGWKKNTDFKNSLFQWYLSFNLRSLRNMTQEQREKKKKVKYTYLPTLPTFKQMNFWIGLHKESNIFL